MKVVICGFVPEFKTLIDFLIEAKFEVILIAEDEGLDKIFQELEIKIVQSNPTFKAILNQYLPKADVLLALTQSDGDNSLICDVGTWLDIPKRIAIIKDARKVENSYFTSIISPSLNLKDEIAETIKNAGIKILFELNDSYFASVKFEESINLTTLDGYLNHTGFSPILHKKSKFNRLDFDIKREIKKNDELYFLIKKNHLKDLKNAFFGKSEESNNFYLSGNFENLNDLIPMLEGKNIEIIEEDLEKAILYSKEFKEVQVKHMPNGFLSDELECAENSFIITATEDGEHNLLSSIVAKRKEPDAFAIAVYSTHSTTLEDLLQVKIINQYGLSLSNLFNEVVKDKFISEIILFEKDEALIKTNPISSINFCSQRKSFFESKDIEIILLSRDGNFIDVQENFETIKNDVLVLRLNVKDIQKLKSLA